MALVVWLTVIGPAFWAGLLLSRIFQGVLAIALPSLLSADQLLALHDWVPWFMISGLMLALIGNLMVGLETGFMNLKRLWVDNLLVYLGVALWLVAALLQGEWWLPLTGQGVAALMMTLQLSLWIARVAIKGDMFLVAFLKLVAVVLALLSLTAMVGWLGL